MIGMTTIVFDDLKIYIDCIFRGAIRHAYPVLPQRAAGPPVSPFLPVSGRLWRAHRISVDGLFIWWFASAPGLVAVALAQPRNDIRPGAGGYCRLSAYRHDQLDRRSEERRVGTECRCGWWKCLRIEA